MTLADVARRIRANPVPVELFEQGREDALHYLEEDPEFTDGPKAIAALNELNQALYERSLRSEKTDPPSAFQTGFVTGLSEARILLERAWPKVTLRAPPPEGP